MDSDTASRFVSSLVQCIQAFCHGYVHFSSSIEIVGHIYLNVDKGSKFDYIVNEEVSKNAGNQSTVYHTNSYHSLPPTKQMLMKTCSHSDSDKTALVSNGHDLQKPVSLLDNISSPLPETDIPRPVSLIQNANCQKGREFVHLQDSLLKLSCNRLSPPVPSPARILLKGKKFLTYHHQEVCNPTLEPAPFIKQEPEISFPACDLTVRKISDAKEYNLTEESLSADELCGDKVKKTSRDKYPLSINIKPEVTDVENIGTSVASKEYTVTERILKAEELYRDKINNASKDLYPLSISMKQDSTDLENLGSSITNLLPRSQSSGGETAFSHSSKSLSAQIKHQIVDYADIVGNRPAARHFGVHESSIRHWRKKFGMFSPGNCGRRGRKRKDHSLEDMRIAVMEASKINTEDLAQ